MKAKKKQKQERRPDTRLLIGLVVGVIIVAVVGLKIATAQQSAATASPSKVTALASAPNPTPQPATAMGPNPPTAAPVAAGSDPFPASPAAQVQWVTRNNKPAMILYHSTTCIPCKAMDQLTKKVRADYEPAVVFVDVITNDKANLPEIRRAKIQVIPTTFFVSASGEIKKQVGAMPEDALRAELARLQAGK